MEKFILTIKDDRKKSFLLELLKQFDFIELQKATEKKTDEYDFFASAGLWENRRSPLTNSGSRHGKEFSSLPRLHLLLNQFIQHLKKTHIILPTQYFFSLPVIPVNIHDIHRPE